MTGASINEQTPPEHLICRVADYGSYFVTRDMGRTVRHAAISALAERDDLDTLVLDFAGVEAITNGCADEMVAGLIAQQDDRRILVERANEDIREAIVTALTRRGLSTDALFTTTSDNGVHHE